MSPFCSVRTIDDSLGIPASTVYSHLVEKIGFKNYFFRWVARQTVHHRIARMTCVFAGVECLTPCKVTSWATELDHLWLEETRMRIRKHTILMRLHKPDLDREVFADYCRTVVLPHLADL
jgi:hypothetical protein